MKKLFFILLLTISCYSQDKISVGIFQDAKLLLGADKAHNNIKPTLDATIYLDLQGKQFKNYYFSMQPFYNQANLSSGYLKRYGVNAVWNFNKLYLPHTTASIGGGIGMLHRTGFGSYSYQVISELSFKLTKKIKLSLRYEFIRRSDIEKFRSNGLIGIKYINK